MRKTKSLCRATCKDSKREGFGSYRLFSRFLLAGTLTGACEGSLCGSLQHNVHNTELHVRTPRPNFYIVWDTTQIVCGSFKAGANLSGRGEQTKNFWKRQQTRENKNTQKKAHAGDAFKVVQKQEAAASFALPQHGLRRLNITCKFFFFF